MNAPLKTLSLLALAALPARAIPTPTSPDLGSIASALNGSVTGKAAPTAPNDAAMTESAMNDMAVNQEKEMEKAMLANGTYKVLVQTKDGAVFQLSDGKWSRSDYSQGMCFLPTTLDKLLANPDLPPSIREAAQKAQQQQQQQSEKEAQAKKETDQKCSSLNAGADPDCNKAKKAAPGGQFAALSLGPTKEAGPEATPEPDRTVEAGASDPTGGTTGDGARDTGVAIGSDMTQNTPGSAMVADSRGLPPPDPGFNRQTQADLKSYNEDVAKTIKGGQIEFTSGFTKHAETTGKVKTVFAEGARILQGEPKNDDISVRSGNSNSFGRGGN